HRMPQQVSRGLGRRCTHHEKLRRHGRSECDVCIADFVRDLAGWPDRLFVHESRLFGSHREYNECGEEIGWPRQVGLTSPSFGTRFWARRRITPLGLFFGPSLWLEAAFWDTLGP